MSTATNNTDAVTIFGRGRNLLGRFVWKEFRMVRGLWLAVAILGLMFQCAAKMLQPPSPEIPTILFAIALAAAALYAAGAAATSFSVEHEEETFDFLARLPATWLPMFAGKLLVIAISAVLLAAGLSFAAWMIGGFREVQRASAVVGVLGVAILEAIAWGTFFSLIIKRPLVAAILTLVVAAVAVNIAVNLSSPRSVAGTQMQGYVDAIPLRMAIVVGVFALSALIARRWLAGDRPSALPQQKERSRFTARLSRVWGRLGQSVMIANRGVRRRMMSRLLWQTWRESWKLLFLPLAIGILLLIAIAAAIGVSVSNHDVAELLMFLTPLFVPTLYGVMAFYADQRRGHYHFLAEHAARPRYVWLARHIIWLGTLVAIWLLVTYIFLALFGAAIRRNSSQQFDDYAVWGLVEPAESYLVYDLARFTDDAIRIASLTAFGGLAAYAIGQFCSMAIRSEIMAAFVALAISAVVSAWGAVLFAWQLSGWVFLLPLFVGFMLATWLRVPDWIAGRNSMRAWLKPALAILAAILWIGLLLPGARLAQVPNTFVHGDTRTSNVHIQPDEAIANELRDFESSITPEARETANMYIQAAERLLAGPEQNLLAPWEKPDYYKKSDVVVFGDEIDVTKIPYDQLDAFQAAQKKQLELVREAQTAAIEAAIEATKRPVCHFEFDLPLLEAIHMNADNRHSYLVNSYPLYANLEILLNNIVFEQQPNGTLVTTDSFDRLLAGLRMSEHLRSGQPYMVFVHQLEKERDILDAVANWAARKERTKDELQVALDKLDFRFHPSLKGPLLADHLLVREALFKNEASLVLARSPLKLYDYLAYLANRLPWERERAIAALNQITLRNMQNTSELAQRVTGSQPLEHRLNPMSRWIQPHFNMPPSWEIQEPAASTSYLASLEYKARLSISELCRTYVDNEASRRAALLRIALAMYRLDHEKHPQRLADLVPQYLKQLPIDPYSNQPFQYLPVGLDLPLEYAYATQQRRIEPHTPLLWSVGASDVLISLQPSRRVPVNDEADAEGATADEASQKFESVYSFSSAEPGWWNWEPLVFPLPR